MNDQTTLLIGILVAVIPLTVTGLAVWLVMRRTQIYPNMSGVTLWPGEPG